MSNFIPSFFNKTISYAASFIWKPKNEEDAKRKSSLVFRTSTLKSCILEMDSNERGWKSAQRNLADALSLTVRHLTNVPQTSASIDKMSGIIEMMENDVSQEVEVYMPDILKKDLTALVLGYLGYTPSKIPLISNEISEQLVTAEGARPFLSSVLLESNIAQGIVLSYLGPDELTSALFHKIADKTRTCIDLTELSMIDPKKNSITITTHQGSVTKHLCQQRFKNGMPFLCSISQTVVKEGSLPFKSIPSQAKTMEEYYKFLEASSAHTVKLPAEAINRSLKDIFLNYPGQMSIRMNHEFFVMREQNEKDLPRYSSLKINDQVLYTDETIGSIGEDDQERIQLIFAQFLPECENDFNMVENLITLFTQGSVGLATKQIYDAFSNRSLDIFVIPEKGKHVAIRTRNLDGILAPHIIIHYTVIFKLNKLEDRGPVPFKTIYYSRITTIGRNDLKTGNVKNGAVKESFSVE